MELNELWYLGYLSTESSRGNLHRRACFHSVIVISEYTALLNHSTTLILLQCCEGEQERIPLLDIEIHLELQGNTNDDYPINCCANMSNTQLLMNGN